MKHAMTGLNFLIKKRQSSWVSIKIYFNFRSICYYSFILGGSEPNIADISVYGVLCSMEGCQAFKDCLDNTKIKGWFYSVKEIVEKNRGNRVFN